jgi:hypothetical protein
MFDQGATTFVLRLLAQELRGTIFPATVANDSRKVKPSIASPSGANRMA